jgi:hypothetical protein
VDVSDLHYPITAVLEGLCKRPETKWLRHPDGSIVITHKDRTFRIKAEVYEDTGTPLLRIQEDEGDKHDEA